MRLPILISPPPAVLATVIPSHSRFRRRREFSIQAFASALEIALRPQCSKTQYWRPAHFDRFLSLHPSGHIAPIRISHIEREDGPLTNEGMLKILCLEVEKLLN